MNERETHQEKNSHETILLIVRIFCTVKQGLTMFVQKYFQQKIQGEIEMMKIKAQTEFLSLFNKACDTWELIECFVKFSGNFGA